MKQLFTIFLFIATLSFTGCSKDDDTPQTPAQTIVGKWRADYIIHHGNMKDTYDPEDASIITFESNGTVTVNGYDLDEKDNKVPVTEKGKYALTSDGKQLTVTANGKTETYQITTLNSLALVLKFVDEDDDSYEQGFVRI